MHALPEELQALLEREKLAALAEFAAGAGHEINNPVATIAARAQLLLKDETDPERRRALAVIGGQALRIRDMIGDLMLFARPPEPKPESLDLSQEIEATVSQLKESIAERHCRLEFQPAESVPIFADRTQIRIVISNLVRNSLEALPDEGGEIAIRCESYSQPMNHGMSCFTVTDNGRGLSEEERRHLFDPFFSGRQAGRGLGFGLCKCWRIVSNHGGRIEVASNDAQTTFQVVWPAEPHDGSGARKRCQEPFSQRRRVIENGS